MLGGVMLVIKVSEIVKQKVFSNAGFTLVEIMVVSAIIGILAVALTSLSQISTKSLLGARAGTDFNSLLNILSTSIENDSSCAKALGLPSALVVPLPTAGSPSSTVFNWPSIMLGSTQISPGSQYGTLTFNSLQIQVNTVPTPVSSDPTHTYFNVNGQINLVVQKPNQAFGSQQLNNLSPPSQLTMQVISGTGAGATATGTESRVVLG